MLYTIITRFGLPGIFLGAGLEGEPFAIAGGLLAHGAIVPLWAAIGAATTGAFAVDLFWFALGRRSRGNSWVRAISRRPGFAKSLAMIDSHATMAVMLFRFAYGLRAIAPVAVGTSQVTTRRFVVLSFVAAMLWGAAFTLIGYGFGATIRPWAGDLAVAGGLLGAMFLLAAVIGIARSRHSRA